MDDLLKKNMEIFGLKDYIPIFESKYLRSVWERFKTYHVGNSMRSLPDHKTIRTFLTLITEWYSRGIF